MIPAQNVLTALQAGGSLSYDPADPNFIYFSTGNARYNPDLGNFGDAIIKMSTTPDASGYLHAVVGRSIRSLCA
jgi:hypothetical protein